MAEHETIADIIAWLRRPREGENAYLTLWRDEIADRLEAAHKRELSKDVSKNGADFGQLGDAAKLREALEELVANIEMRSSTFGLNVIVDTKTYLDAKTALAAPATTENPSAVGDAAKLREALNRLVIASEGFLKTHSAKYYVDTTEALDKAKAALAAPPRNCDRFATLDEARKAHEEYRGDYIMRASNKFDFPMEFEAWLVAPATEKEGANDGNE